MKKAIILSLVLVLCTTITACRTQQETTTPDSSATVNIDSVESNTTPTVSQSITPVPLEHDSTMESSTTTEVVAANQENTTAAKPKIQSSTVAEKNPVSTTRRTSVAKTSASSTAKTSTAPTTTTTVTIGVPATKPPTSVATTKATTTRPTTTTTKTTTTAKVTTTTTKVTTTTTTPAFDYSLQRKVVQAADSKINSLNSRQRELSDYINDCIARGMGRSSQCIAARNQQSQNNKSLETAKSLRSQAQNAGTNSELYSIQSQISSISIA